MSIAIEKSKCIGCGACVEACPGNLLKIGDDGKAFTRCEKDCWGCTACVKECKFSAIKFYLGADIGGMGSSIHTQEQGDILSWIIEKSDGEVSRIDIDKKEANHY